jgi:Family of unknown function (DUF6188)
MTPVVAVEFQIGHYVSVPEPYVYDSEGHVRQGSTDRPGDDGGLRIPKTDLTFVRIDYQTRLQFESTEVVIECPFTLQVGEVTHNLDPGDRANLGPILALYPDRLDEATVDTSATLRLRFASGASIEVGQDIRYEAWQVNGPGNYLVVCTPGTDGKLAIWD